MKLLFICNQNKNRSKTAEIIFKRKFETKSADLYNSRPVSKKQLEWADMIIVMEDEQRKEIGMRFPDMYIKKRIISLNLPDIYFYNQPELVKQLESKIKLLV